MTVRAPHTPIGIPLRARGPTDTVYVLNMCGEYLSGADFRLPTPFDVGASQTLACPPPTLASPPRLSIFIIKLLAGNFLAETLESIFNKLVKTFFFS